MFCAFEGCSWEDRFGTEEQLHQHLQEKHSEPLEAIRQHMLLGNAQDALYSAYYQAIAEKCRGQAPVAGTSLDRRALKNLAEATKGNKIEALMCFSCGGIHPFLEEAGESSSIKWYQPLQRNESTGELRFLGQPLKTIEDLLGLQVYLSRYNLVEPGQVKLTDHETFDDWRMRLPELDDGVLLCCPEAGKECLSSGPACHTHTSTHFGMVCNAKIDSIFVSI